MKLLTEGDPRQKVSPENVSAVPWPVRRALRCPPVLGPAPELFRDVLEDRRTSRAMSPAPLREIVNFLAYSALPRSRLSDDILERTRRPSPSAGALHPIEIIIADWRTRPRLMRYSPLQHELEVLCPQRRPRLNDFVAAVREIVPLAKGTALVSLGDLSRVASLYENPASLIWRDAGALLQTLFLSATAFRLAFCPLGIRGYEIAEALDLQDRVISVGVCMVGRNASNG